MIAATVPNGTQPDCGRISVIEEVAMLCRHCGRVRVNRPRGLCWSCYYTPGIRERYPSYSKFARRGLGIGGGHPPLPPTPTSARPGTPEKVRVMEQRARNHQSLWHPDDAPMDRESYPIGA
jgi:ribosomal protein L37E